VAPSWETGIESLQEPRRSAQPHRLTYSGYLGATYNARPLLLIDGLPLPAKADVEGLFVPIMMDADSPRVRSAQG
jgi:hypothetical protein